LLFPIDFDGRPYNTLTLPCERVIRRGSAQGSALISKFDRFIRKIRKIYNGAYGEIMTKF